MDISEPRKIRTRIFLYQGVSLIGSKWTKFNQMLKYLIDSKIISIFTASYLQKPHSMGLEIKRTDKNLYSLKSTISDESYHPEKEWVTEDEAKATLIESAFCDFIDKAIKIDMEFPRGYSINGKREIFDKTEPNPKPSYYDWALQNNTDEAYKAKFEELYKRLKLTFKI